MTWSGKVQFIVHKGETYLRILEKNNFHVLCDKEKKATRFDTIDQAEKAIDFFQRVDPKPHKKGLKEWQVKPVME